MQFGYVKPALESSASRVTMISTSLLYLPFESWQCCSGSRLRTATIGSTRAIRGNWRAGYRSFGGFINHPTSRVPVFARTPFDGFRCCICKVFLGEAHLFCKKAVVQAAFKNLFALHSVHPSHLSHLPFRGAAFYFNSTGNSAEFSTACPTRCTGIK